jgi:F0F1-type ATP synthase assembly protein I
VAQQENKNDYMRAYAKYFGLMIQMILLVVGGGFGGKALDSYFKIEPHIFTIIFIILATILSLYLFFKTLFNK